MARAAGQFGRRPGAPLALAIYLVAALVLLGAPLLSHPARDCLCIVGTKDEAPTSWALAWWPHALAHGLNPFFPKLIYAPQGIDIAQGAMLPGLALALAPVTALGGPLFSYNLAALLGPPLAATFAFLLCRRVISGPVDGSGAAPAGDARPARAFWPALVGGWLFGFSTYMFGQETGHLNLTLVFLVPAIAHLGLRAFAGELRGRWLVFLLTAALVAQFSLSVEVFATLTLFGALGLALAWLPATPAVRRSLRAMLAPIGLAYLLTAVIVSPYLYYALKPGGEPILPARSGKFSSDLLGFVVPSVITRIGGLDFLGTTLKFTAGYVEGAAYLGLPLLALVLLAVRTERRRPEVRWLAGMLLIAVVLSLGAHLHVAGSSTIPLPWALVDHLPFLGIVLPSRLVMFATLFVAVLAAIGLARSGARAPVEDGFAGRARALRYLPGALAAAAVVSLWPAVNLPFWHSHPDQPRLFTTSAYRRVFRARDNVLVLPIGIYGLGMLWQSEAHLGFTMAGGYVVPPEAPDPYQAFKIYPTLAYNADFPGVEQAAARFIATERITVAVLSATGARLSVWPRILTGLGWRGVVRGGAIVFRPARRRRSCSRRYLTGASKEKSGWRRRRSRG